MTIKKSYYDMLKWVCKNTARKAVLIPEIYSVVKNSICYIPEMDLCVGFYECGNTYVVHKLRVCPATLDRKEKKTWEIEDLTDVEQKVIQEYIKTDGDCEMFNKEKYL